jgi:hypothetical protein
MGRRLSLTECYRVSKLYLVIVKTRCRFIKAWMSRRTSFRGVSEGGILSAGWGAHPSFLRSGGELGEARAVGLAYTYGTGGEIPPRAAGFLFFVRHPVSNRMVVEALRYRENSFYRLGE